MYVYVYIYTYISELFVLKTNNCSITKLDIGTCEIVVH